MVDPIPLLVAAGLVLLLVIWVRVPPSEVLPDHQR
jgi:hypothetical protein